MLCLIVTLLWRLEEEKLSPSQKSLLLCVVCRNRLGGETGWHHYVMWVAFVLYQRWYYKNHAASLFKQKHLILCVWRGENETECSRKRVRKLTRTIPGKMILSQLLSGMVWFINWNPIFNCTGLFLPNKHALLAVWRPEKKGPFFVVF